MQKDVNRLAATASCICCLYISQKSINHWAHAIVGVFCQLMAAEKESVKFNLQQWVNKHQVKNADGFKKYTGLKDTHIQASVSNHKATARQTRGLVWC